MERLDDFLEDAWAIFQRERDQLPTSLRREILHQKVLAYAAPHLAARVTPPPAQRNQPAPHDDHAH